MVGNFYAKNNLDAARPKLIMAVVPSAELPLRDPSATTAHH